MNRRPYDDKGHFVPLSCPHMNCGGGTLQHTGEPLYFGSDKPGPYWRCDGLAAPERDDQPLYACDYIHVDGEPYHTGVATA